jgi:molecular chaperone Hsp33
MSDPDSLHRFLFEHAGVRGQLVHLDASWQAVLDAHPYPAPVRRQLGAALAAVVLLTSTLKFEGSLILQVQGDGPLRTLVAQANEQCQVRGLARWDADVPGGDLEQVFGNGRLVLTLEPKRGENYQGIVPLQGADLASALEGYFNASEQLPTKLWLAADEQRAAGMLIQRLPAHPGPDEDWDRIGLLAGTVKQQELLRLPTQELLYRLFNEETVRLFDSEPVAFRCGCSLERIEDTLRALGRAEVESILDERGAVDVNCEFCNRRYHLDRIDALKLFGTIPHHGVSETRH